MVVMTQNPGQTTSPSSPVSGVDRFFTWLRGVDVRRDTENKWLGGVCSGTANRLGVDPLVIRAVLVVLILLGGVGITLYLIAWAFLPNDREEILAEKGIRGGDFWAIALLVLIALALVGGSGFMDGSGWGLWWLWWLAVLVGLVVWLASRNRGAPATSATWQSAAAPSTPSGPSPSVSGPGAPGDPYPSPYAAASPGRPGAPGGPGPALPPPLPPRPRRRSAGFLVAVIVTGLALAAYGLTSWAHATYDGSGDQHVVALAAALVVFGLSVLAMGLAGLRSGLTGLLALLLAVTTWLGAVLPDVDVGGGVGDREWRPRGTTTSESFRLGIGSANLHLGDYPTDASTPGEVNARVGVGELQIYVPEDLTVEIRSDVGAGEIREARGWGLDEENRWSQDGPGGRNLSSTEIIGTGPPDLVVHARVGLGQITIGKE